MNVKGMTIGRATVFAAVTFGLLTTAALSLPAAKSPEHVIINGHLYAVPDSAETSRVLLPDGRMLNVAGTEGTAYISDKTGRKRLPLPETRRFASVTVMPGGQVLFWGGIDAKGHVLDTGEWFDPRRERFVPTGLLGLPARAGHSLTVLSNGSLLMTGGWSADGRPATEALVWAPQSHQVAVVHDASIPRIDGDADLQPDGSIRLEGGVDARGLPVAVAERFDLHTQRLSAVAATRTSAPLIAALPDVDVKSAPLQGPLNLRFGTAMDVRTLDPKTVTLIGPEGAVPIHVVATNEGRQAFVQLPDDLYPGSRYTLFVKGLQTASGHLVPYTAVGFTTARHVATGVVMAGQGAMPSPTLPTSYESNEPPLSLMAGGGVQSCTLHDDQLCRAHGYVRDGAFYPGQNNAPTSTGDHWRLYAAHQSLPDTRALEARLSKDDTVLIGQVRQIDEKPVAHVAISVGDETVYTDARGVFVLKGLHEGREHVFVDGAPASHDDVHYGRFLVGADVKAKAITHMPYVMYLPRILPRDEITLPSPTTREVVLQHPDMPGLELRIPAGAVFKDKDGHVLTHVAIVPTPVDHAPFPLPDNFPMYFTIQPGDAVVQGLTPDAAKGMRVVYPNYGHDKPNTPGNFWVYSAQDGWRMYGGGHVTRDGLHMAPDPGVALVWAMGAGVSAGNANPPTTQKPNNKAVAEPIDVQTGAFYNTWNDLKVNDIMPLSLDRKYSSADSNSHVFGIGANAFFGMHLYSADSSFNTLQLVLASGEGLVFNIVAGTQTTWPLAGTVWEHTGTDSAFYGATLQFFNSPSEIWIITLKDGTTMGFQSEVPNQLLWIKDRFGNALTLNYNGGLVDQLISPSGRSITLNYDSGNRISTATDNSGRAISYRYNSTGTLAEVDFPDKTSEKYTYDSNKRMLTMQDRRGNAWVTNVYDANGRVSMQTYADHTAYQFVYTTDTHNNVTAATITDPNGNNENVTFDPVSGYTATDTYAYGTALAQTTTYVREASGLVDSETDALGRKTAYSYDALGNVTSVTRLAGTTNAVTTQLTYTTDYNQLASVTDPLGHVTQFGYTNGCLTQVTDPLNHASTITCNTAGQPRAATDALGNKVSFGYNGYDLSRITDPLGRSIHYVTDTLGRRTATRDPLGNVTLVAYDTNDRVVSATDALNQTTTLNYDGNGNLTSVALPNTGVITYVYDNRNRLITRTDAMNQSESWAYSGLGQVLTHTDRKGQITEISYDALNRRSLVSYADGSGTQANYDAGNRLTSLVDSASGTLSWGYDDLDRVTGTSSAQGSLSYTYDAAGRRTGMTAAAQATATYTYDNANRLTGITQGSETVQLAYDADNRRTTLTLPNGITVNYGYDNASELAGLTYNQNNGTSLGNLTYGYDADGRIISKSGTFATDVLPTATTQPATFDLNDRETSFSGQALTYDANGNLTSDGTNTYTWNARNQLTQISQGGTARLSFSYDALGRRISKTMQGTATQFLYDGNNAVQETQGSAINPILVGLGVDERFARNDVTGRTYFLADLLNTTIALTDSMGAIKQQYSYDPYGNVTPNDTTTGFTNPYQFTGREADTSALYYYRARYYSPMMGGYISEDPAEFLGGQLTFYGYAGADPLDYNDPYGLWLPPAIPTPIYNFALGMADDLSFGIGPLLRAEYDIAGPDRCSEAYKYGGYASLFVGVGRLGYAASAKVISKVAVDGLAASAGRNALKAVFRGGIATSYRAYTYEQMLGKYGTDEAVQAAAGRTSTLFNAPAADAVAGYFSNLDINGTGCGCK
ncbi:RHS repeat-associated core domain-containing protein [Caballeronia ptereochthonis]|uniref:Rhs family protein n=1 Tax=Caballeronia ptereochthonis TaxID=1777144 RepID=A0A157Z2N8_9BURK|nr:RHS repeat-associated core domain-containing protein [Caballeronia ptereochthonis]SAK39693.1 Rhs family protein [Caballeronia ptereochthonis]